MNYFAHGLNYLDQPFFLAGSAVPDWLSVVDRRMRVRSRSVRPFLEDSDPRVAAIAAGVLQHLHDDQWFHQTRAFAELSLQLTVKVRDTLADEAGFRPSFLGHILVEIFLDAVLIEEDPARLDEYYRVMDAVDSDFVATTVNRMANHPSELLAVFIPRFLAERFLYDYLDDEKLLRRLNQVMGRVGLTPLPSHFLELFPATRRSVRDRYVELLTAPTNTHENHDPTGETTT